MNEPPSRVTKDLHCLVLGLVLPRKAVLRGCIDSWAAQIIQALDRLCILIVEGASQLCI